MDTAVVLVSGGVNSLVLTGVAAKEYTLALMHVGYGQRTQDRDLACFRSICDRFTPAKRAAIALKHFEAVGGNARVDKNLTIEPVSALGSETPSTYVPGLIPTLLGLAFHWASAIGAKHILIGSSENDGPPCPRTSLLFPDHRRDLYHLYNQLIEIAAKRNSKIQLHTPLIEMTREEVVRLGQHLSVPFELSWS
ncbi:unnamed protein product, partial [marine sediment metagenome]